MALEAYNKKRDFEKTSEPRGKSVRSTGHRFVVQEHHARHLHYDLRLEMDGVLKSWAVPKGPSLDPSDRRLAVMTEDHPVKYIDFQGHIPAGNYGEGDMAIWDMGCFEAVDGKDPVAGVASGKLHVSLFGEKLHGEFILTRMPDRGGDKNNWLLIKMKDEYAEPGWQLEPALQSVPAQAGTTGRASTSAPIPGARPSPLPESFKPMLATLVDEPVEGPEWLYEVKWDGFRAVCFVRDQSATLISRNNNSLTERFPEIAAALSKLKVQEAVLDGEIVAVDAAGRASFQLLQNRLGTKAKESGGALVLYAFDLLYLNGFDLTASRLIDRKNLLQSLLAENHLTLGGAIRYSDHFSGEGQGNALMKQAKAEALEGIIAKQRDSPYLFRRSEKWLKIKILHTQTAIICGFTAPRNSRPYFGALVLGVCEGKQLRYIGHTGTGFTGKSLNEIYHLLQPLATNECPFEKAPKTNEPVHWLPPQICCEIKFGEWTRDLQLRHPVFIGLRPDKKPSECELEVPRDTAVAVEEAERETMMEAAAPGRRPSNTKTILLVEDALKQPQLEGDLQVRVGNHDLTLTNLHKVLWPQNGYTKGDLIRYYFEVAEAIIPHLTHRPLILQRYPNGISKQPFYQHNMSNEPPFLQTYTVREGNEPLRYALCNDLVTLLYLANLGTITQNPWNSRVDEPGKPDWIVFDLDPGEGVGFDILCRVALTVKDVLEELGLESHAKTSGSRGLHVYLPLQRSYSYDQVTDFAALVAVATQIRHPKEVTTERLLRQRPRGTLYLDTMQNREGKSVAAVWSVRPKPGATVSTPLSWDEVRQIPDPTAFTIRSVPQRLQQQADLFKPVLQQKQGLKRALGRLEKLLEKTG